MSSTPLPLVIAGARGHGRWHLENIRRLQQAGLVRLVGICEVEPLSPAELDGLGDPAQSTDFGSLLDATGAAVAVICTPIPTHADLAVAAASRGVHLLLEKPPAPSYADFLRIGDAVTAAGVACQIGFQSLGSHAVPAVRALVADGAIGEPMGVGAAGAWVRDEAYYRRAPWAGRRRLDGVDVVDGVLTNPLAHAVATALAVDGSTLAEDVARVDPELFRANAIESDDTSFVGITTARGGRVGVAATLCAERPAEPYVIVHGTEGRITLWYKQDRVLVQRAGHGSDEVLHGRTDLLENLVDHLAGRAGLLVPPASTGAFMKVVESIRRAPDPRPLPVEAWRSVPGAYEGVRRRIVHGIDGLVAASADTLCGYAELGTFWALPNGNPAARLPAAGPSTTEPAAPQAPAFPAPAPAPTPTPTSAPGTPAGQISAAEPAASETPALADPASGPPAPQAATEPTADEDRTPQTRTKEPALDGSPAARLPAAGPSAAEPAAAPQEPAFPASAPAAAPAPAPGTPAGQNSAAEPAASEPPALTDPASGTPAPQAATAEPTADEDLTPQTRTTHPTPDGSPAPQTPTPHPTTPHTPTPEPTPAENPPR